jgi:hypothetical protein
MIVQDGQNIFDIILQEFGDLELLFDELLIPNNLSVDSILKPGQQIYLNTTGKGNESVKNYIKTNNLSINNGNIIFETIITDDIAFQWPIYVDLNEAININLRQHVE